METETRNTNIEIPGSGLLTIDLLESLAREKPLLLTPETAIVQPGSFVCLGPDLFNKQYAKQGNNIVLRSRTITSTHRIGSVEHTKILRFVISGGPNVTLDTYGLTIQSDGSLRITDYLHKLITPKSAAKWDSNEAKPHEHVSAVINPALIMEYFNVTSLFSKFNIPLPRIE